MRIGYSDDEDFPGQFELWQANCQRSLNGKKGQAALKELEVALLALRDKRLIADKLQDANGDVCALGALARYKGQLIATAEAEDGAEDEWEENDMDAEMEEFGVSLGMPRLVAWKVVSKNDIEIRGTYDYSKEPRGTFVPVTPEQRYERLLAWVQQKIQ